MAEKDNKERRSRQDTRHISWHPAFVQASKVTLEKYKDALQFDDEYQLTKDPLRIDIA
jgi:hypothetical protein